MNYLKLIIFTAICASTTANASSVTCPTTVKAGKPLIIKAEFTHSECDTIENSVLSLLGNSASAIGLQGPFVTPLVLPIIPPTNCNPDIKIPETLESLVVIKSVPSGMKGKLAVASAGVLDAKNNLIMAGSCLVTVIK
jgi:hypothetical protein